jgi:hypothetical protein
MEDLTASQLTTGQCGRVQAIWLSPAQPHLAVAGSLKLMGPEASDDR